MAITSVRDITPIVLVTLVAIVSFAPYVYVKFIVKCKNVWTGGNYPDRVPCNCKLCDPNRTRK